MKETQEDVKCTKSSKRTQRRYLMSIVPAALFLLATELELPKCLDFEDIDREGKRFNNYCSKIEKKDETDVQGKDK